MTLVATRKTVFTYGTFSRTSRTEVAYTTRTSVRPTRSQGISTRLQSMFFGDRAESTFYPGVTKERQPNGDYKWFATDLTSGERVEIDPEQAVFWTPEWQHGQQKALDDVKQGRVRRANSALELIRGLRADAE